MGYTHYWKKEQDIPADQMAELLRFSGTIIARSNVPLGDYSGEGKPVLSPDSIEFNGVEDDGHESFILDSGAESFVFCKTAQKPYDVVVVAILMAAADICDGFSWSSDGDKNDHEEGKALYEACKPKPSHWEENQEQPVTDWQYEVANGGTRLGYSEWVKAKRA